MPTPPQLARALIVSSMLAGLGCAYGGAEVTTQLLVRGHAEADAPGLDEAIALSAPRATEAVHAIWLSDDGIVRALDRAQLEALTDGDRLRLVRASGEGALVFAPDGRSYRSPRLLLSEVAVEAGGLRSPATIGFTISSRAGGGQVSVIGRVDAIAYLDGTPVPEASRDTLVTASSGLAVPRLEGYTFTRGDADLDGRVTISDAVKTLNYLFLGAERVACADAADADDDGALNLSDGVFILNFLFQGGAAPPAPYPAAGIDPTTDELRCEPSDYDLTYSSLQDAAYRLLEGEPLSEEDHDRLARFREEIEPRLSAPSRAWMDEVRQEARALDIAPDQIDERSGELTLLADPRVDVLHAELMDLLRSVPDAPADGELGQAQQAAVITIGALITGLVCAAKTGACTNDANQVAAQCRVQVCPAGRTLDLQCCSRAQAEDGANCLATCGFNTPEAATECCVRTCAAPGEPCTVSAGGTPRRPGTMCCGPNEVAAWAGICDLSGARQSNNYTGVCD